MKSIYFSGVQGLSAKLGAVRLMLHAQIESVALTRLHKKVFSAFIPFIGHLHVFLLEFVH